MTYQEAVAACAQIRGCPEAQQAIMDQWLRDLPEYERAIVDAAGQVYLNLWARAGYQIPAAEQERLLEEYSVGLMALPEVVRFHRVPWALPVSAPVLLAKRMPSVQTEESAQTLLDEVKALQQDYAVWRAGDYPAFAGDAWFLNRFRMAEIAPILAAEVERLIETCAALSEDNARLLDGRDGEIERLHRVQAELQRALAAEQGLPEGAPSPGWTRGPHGTWTKTFPWGSAVVCHRDGHRGLYCYDKVGRRIGEGTHHGSAWQNMRAADDFSGALQ